MMFFKDTRSVGLVLWIVAALMQFNAAMVLLGAFFDGFAKFPDSVTDRMLYGILLGGGAAVSTALYAANAHRIMSKPLTKVQVLKGYVMTVGLCTALCGALGGIATYLYTDDPRAGLMTTVITVVLGTVAVLMQVSIDNGKKGALKKLIWAVLVAAFVLMAIDSVLPADNYWQFAEHIAHLLIAFFMVMFISDREVMVEMGARS